jgi:hypothetical protein
MSQKNDASYNPFGMDYMGGSEEHGIDKVLSNAMFLANKKWKEKHGTDMFDMTNGNGMSMEVHTMPDGGRVFIPSDHNVVSVPPSVASFENDQVCEHFSVVVSGSSKTECEFCKQNPCFLEQIDPLLDEENDLQFVLGQVGDEMMEAEIETKSIRYQLYKIAATFVHGKLGKGIRKPLPKCILGEIQDSFPAAKGTGYVGFKEA